MTIIDDLGFKLDKHFVVICDYIPDFKRPAFNFQGQQKSEKMVRHFERNFTKAIETYTILKA